MFNTSTAFIISAILAFSIIYFLFIKEKNKGRNFINFLMGFFLIVFGFCFYYGSNNKTMGYFFLAFGVFTPILSRILLSERLRPAELTPDFLKQRRIEMDDSKYRKWLRREYTGFVAEIYERKEKGLRQDPSLINVLKLIEKESEEIEKQTGESALKGEKVSKEFEEFPK